MSRTAESKYWRQFKLAKTTQQVGAVTDIDFSPVYPYNYLVTASTKLLLYDARSHELIRRFSRFPATAYSGTFRSDGKLVVAGGESGVVQVFKADSATLLRQFKGHKRPVHVTRFTQDRLHVLSGGDDALVQVWDLTMGAAAWRGEGHSDYVRAAALSPSDPALFATGSYDHTCKLWDSRTRSAALSLDHGAPIEAVMYLPAGTMVATAGGDRLCIWDMLAGGRLAAQLSNHRKTITSLALAQAAGPASAAGPRLLAGSLDGLVKCYDLDRFKVTHAMSFPSPVMSVGVSPDTTALAVGMANGTLLVKKRRRRPAAPGQPGEAGRRVRYEQPPRTGSRSYFLRGRREGPGPQDTQVPAPKRVKTPKWTRLLRNFRYRDALDAVLRTQRPQTVVEVLLEIEKAPDGIKAALGNRTPEGLQPVLAFLAAWVAHPQYAAVLIPLTQHLLDIYGPSLGSSPEVLRVAGLVARRVAAELVVGESLGRLQGALHPILVASPHTKSDPYFVARTMLC